MLEAVALAFGLAMDATAVSAARGLGARDRKELVILPLLFGGFQSGMSALGWLGGRWIEDYLAGWQNWVGFALLALIGGKMLYEALRAGPDREPTPGSLALYLGLAIATSIDAAAAGLTLPMLPVSPAIALALIGGVTAACSLFGYLAGRKLGERFGSRIEIIGGLVLIAIGVRLLLG